MERTDDIKRQADRPLDEAKPGPRKWYQGRLAKAAGILGLLLLVTGGISAVIVASTDNVPRGQWYWGQSLVINFQDLQYVPEIRYTDENSGHWIVRPTEAAHELIAVKLDVRNNGATESLFSVGDKSLRLRDTDYLEYSPINPLAQRMEGPGASPLENRHSPFIWGNSSLPKDWRLEGWVIFEVPKDLGVSQVVWESGDTVYMNFKECRIKVIWCFT